MTASICGWNADRMPLAESVRAWGGALVRTQSEAAEDALRSLRERPRSARRLHTARIALARLHAALEDLGGCLPRAAELRARVKAARDLCGRARDADVLLERLDGYRAATDGRERAELEGLARAVRKRRGRALRLLENALRRGRAELGA